MRSRTSVHVAVRSVVVVLLAAFAAPGRTQAPDAAADAYPLTLAVGESVALCDTGTLLCPAAGTRCDDLSVVGVGADPRGPVLKGLAPGTTLCSAATASGQGPRRVYRVTVKPKRR